MKVRIAHVTESLGGGTETAIATYVENTPEFEHVVIGRYRPESTTGEVDLLGTQVFRIRTPSPLLLRHVVPLLRETVPTIIHLHSSYAGAQFRAVRRRLGDNVRVVYTPHCFAFLRGDIGPLQSVVYRTVERHLVGRTDVLVAASGPELDEARAIGHRRVVHAPHTLTRRRLKFLRSLATKFRSPERTGRPVVAAMGRVVRQKGIDYFAEVVRALDRRDVEWTWIGGGRTAQEALLRELGVRITGWLSNRDALAELARADVYCHTAQWEVGIPYAVLEAEALGIPAIVRRLPYSGDFGGPRPEHPHEFAKTIEMCLEKRCASSAERPVAALHWESLKQAQRIALHEAYGLSHSSDLQKLARSF